MNGPSATAPANRAVTGAARAAGRGAAAGLGALPALTLLVVAAAA